MNNPSGWDRDRLPSSGDLSSNRSGVQPVAGAYDVPPASHQYGAPQQQYPMVVHNAYPTGPHAQYPQQPHYNQYAQYGQPTVVVQHVVQRRGTRTRGTAALLAFFFGGIGIHKFYLGRPGLGILYCLFCWTFVPAFLAFIDLVILLCASEESFDRQYNQ